ncbi:nicotinate-nucleotide adenylyltransferase [Pontibacillus salipaludis]|uniref:nicotinate-nucleotide adenylyltransferase n=1 Tax=Pontibacillus salipaludis TaxID=1697394 RepID=UPI0031F127E4
MKKIGLLGGTFDPPHMGHLLIAEEVYQELGLDEVWFIPSNDPPHKTATNTKVNDRLEMTQLAIDSNPHFKINTIEIERSGTSYTFDTVKTLIDEFEDIQFYFIMGGDMVEYLPKWNRIDELVEMITFVGVKRKGHELSSPYPIQTIDIPVFEVSSTFIRERMMQGRSARYLLPQSVESYIKERGLYGPE